MAACRHGFHSSDLYPPIPCKRLRNSPDKLGARSQMYSEVTSLREFRHRVRAPTLSFDSQESLPAECSTYLGHSILAPGGGRDELDKQC